MQSGTQSVCRHNVGKRNHIYKAQALWRSGPWFNIKTPSYQCRESHCGDKTVVRSSYLHNGISYTGKMISLYWIRAQYTLGSFFLLIMAITYTSDSHFILNWMLLFVMLFLSNLLLKNFVSNHVTHNLNNFIHAKFIQFTSSWLKTDFLLAEKR